MHRHVLLLLTCALSGACAHWRPETRPVAEVIAEEPIEVRIVRRDRSEIIVVEPRVTGATVTGVLGRPRGDVVRDSSVAVPLSDMAAWYAWDPGSPALAYVLGLAAVALMVRMMGTWLAACCGS